MPYLFRFLARLDLGICTFESRILFLRIDWYFVHAADICSALRYRAGVESVQGADAVSETDIWVVCKSPVKLMWSVSGEPYTKRMHRTKALCCEQLSIKPVDGCLYHYLDVLGLR